MIFRILNIWHFVPGNHYGTPKPPKEPKDPNSGPIQRSNSAITVLPGQHPSSEGKRKRNRSNIEATAKSPISRPAEAPPAPPGGPGSQKEEKGKQDDLGALPSNWEMAYTDDGTPYFIE